MKFAKAFLIALVLAAVAGFISAHTNLYIPGFLHDAVEQYAKNKTTADSYPVAVHLLLLFSALPQLLATFGLSTTLLYKAQEKLTLWVLRIGGGLLGVVGGMIASFLIRGIYSEVNLGIALIVFIATYIIAPIFIAYSLRYLDPTDPDPKREQIGKVVVRIATGLMCTLSVIGIIRIITS